jgi:two-component system, cell cycle response regulator DivK
MALILIVEDDIDNQEVFATMLQIAGHTSVMAANGEEGLRLVEELRPDLILMDMGMPVMDGWTAAELLRANPALADIPIIAVTSYAMAEDARRALAVGCNDYLSKPIDYYDLIDKIEALLPH